MIAMVSSYRLLGILDAVGDVGIVGGGVVAAGRVSNHASEAREAGSRTARGWRGCPRCRCKLHVVKVSGPPGRRLGHRPADAPRSSRAVRRPMRDWRGARTHRVLVAWALD